VYTVKNVDIRVDAHGHFAAVLRFAEFAHQFEDLVLFTNAIFTSQGNPKISGLFVMARFDYSKNQFKI